MKFAIFVGKIIILVGKILHRGSVLPGYWALKFDKNLLKKVQIPDMTIAITGSDGKTSTSNCLASIFKKSGHTVAHNISGSNLLNGIATTIIESIDYKGNFTKDALVLEIDERFIQTIFKYFVPKYLLITNISRDQPPRNGHPDVIFNILKNAITEDIHLILNIDDPLVYNLKNYHNKITTFGVSKNERSYQDNQTNTIELAYCPLCSKKLKFSYFNNENIGNYSCPTKDFKRDKPDYEVTSINYDKLEFIVNKKIKVAMQNDLIYNVYNNVAAYTVASLVGIPETDICSAIEDLKFTTKRFEEFNLDNRKGYILSSKNENAISYNQSINYITSKKEDKTVVIGFDYISKRYSYRDLSWLWDIDFERLKDTKINKVICIGPFAYDIAVRIKYAGIKEKDIIVKKEYKDDLKEIVKTKTKGSIYSVIYFDMSKIFTKGGEE